MVNDFAPVLDETLFSWLHRQSIFFEGFKYPLYLLLEDFERYRRLESFDRDFDFDSSFATEALRHLSLNRSHCESIFGSSKWLLPEHYRQAFCWECLQEHVKKTRYPCHLKAWCRVLGTHCEVHYSLLRQHPRSDRLTLNTALGAFVYFCDNKSKFGLDELHYYFSDPLIASYCIRMSSYVESLEGNAGAESVSYIKLYKLLMGVVLTPSYGIISTILHRRRETPRSSNVWQALTYAPVCASVIDRALAMLLVGIAMRKFTESESSEILKFLSGSKYLDVRFDDLKSLGTACNVFTHETGEVIARALNYSCLSLPNAPLSEFLAGFLSRLKRR